MEKKPAISEFSNSHQISFRRAIYLRKDIPKGKIIKKEDIIALRPNNGIDALDTEKIIGKRTKTHITRFDMFE